MTLRQDADTMIKEAIAGVQPDAAVRAALEKAELPERVHLVAAGKAAWQMAASARAVLGARIADGVVVTKYGHSRGPLGNLAIFEAGHPVPDEHSFQATEAAIRLVRPLGAGETVLFLLSGGGSALFEKPLIPGGELQAVTNRLLAAGADITEINTVRKRLSAVKGGRFAELCAPARVFSVVLSDVVGDRLDMIASGPAYPDASTSEEALEIAERYALNLSPAALSCLKRETPKALSNVETVVTGSVRQLCAGAAAAAEKLGYEPQILTDSLGCEAREAGAFLAAVARYHAGSKKSLAFLAGGETVVHLTGRGLGGRNQELALAAAPGLDGLRDTAVFSFGSDGTDGPTDAAGGYVDGDTLKKLAAHGISVPNVLRSNDAYHALQACGGLIVTGPTGTNVNDVSVVLVRR
jgi:glycerate 2-kinase